MTHWAVKDILHYYMGCLFRYETERGKVIIAKLELLNRTDYMCGDGIDGEWYEIDDVYSKGKLQLILHDPSDMTEDQKDNYYLLCHKVYDSNQTQYYRMDTPASLHFLFKNHIDAFNLIEYGAAIDIKTIHEQLKEQG